MYFLRLFPVYTVHSFTKFTICLNGDFASFCTGFHLHNKCLMAVLLNLNRSHSNLVSVESMDKVYPMQKMVSNFYTIVYIEQT